MMNILKEWRKRHGEPGQAGTMTRETAQAIVGLSADGYANQLSGRRPLSRQTVLLMIAWGLMTKRQRTVFATVAKALDVSRRRVTFDYDHSSVEGDADRSHFWRNLFDDVESFGMHYHRFAHPETALDRQPQMEPAQLDRLEKTIEGDCSNLSASGGPDGLS